MRGKKNATVARQPVAWQPRHLDAQPRSRCERGGRGRREAWRALSGRAPTGKEVPSSSPLPDDGDEMELEPAGCSTAARQHPSAAGWWAPAKQVVCWSGRFSTLTGCTAASTSGCPLQRARFTAVAEDGSARSQWHNLQAVRMQESGAASGSGARERAGAYDVRLGQA